MGIQHELSPECEGEFKKTKMRPQHENGRKLKNEAVHVIRARPRNYVQNIKMSSKNKNEAKHKNEAET